MRFHEQPRLLHALRHLEELVGECKGAGVLGAYEMKPPHAEQHGEEVGGVRALPA
jgi:hypothetical protein